MSGTIYGTSLVIAAGTGAPGAAITLSTLANAPSYANDAAAAAGGVPLNTLYRNGNFVMVRLT